MILPVGVIFVNKTSTGIKKEKFDLKVSFDIFEWYRGGYHQR